MAQPVKIIPRNYYNVIIAKIWPYCTALDLIESWERLDSDSGIHSPNWPEIFIFYYWSDIGLVRIRPTCSIWASIGMDSLMWDCPYHMIDFILSTSYCVITMDITINPVLLTIFNLQYVRSMSTYQMQTWFNYRIIKYPPSYVPCYF